MENENIHIGDKILFLLMMLSVILGLAMGTSTTYHQYKDLVTEQREQIKMLEQSLSEQIEEKQVYEIQLKILKEEYEGDNDGI